MAWRLLRLIVFMLITLRAGAAAYGQVAPCSNMPLSPGAVYKGVPALKNKVMGNGDVWCQGIPYVYGLPYECVEYVRRFYAQGLNYSPAKTAAWQGNANTFLGENVKGKTTDEVNAARGLVAFKNGSSTTPPALDDILVFYDPSNEYGHVAIVTGVIDSGNHTNFTVNIIEQNWSATGIASLPMSKGSDGTYTLDNRVAKKATKTTPAVIYTTAGWAHLAISCIPGLVGWWPGEGNENDIAGGHNGTSYNGVTFAPGEVGQAFSFDGIDDNVRIPFNPIFNSHNALTLEAWVFPVAFPSSTVTFFGKWDSVDGLDQRSYAFNVDAGGTVTFYINTDGSHENFQTITSSNNVPLNTWSHVAGVYDGSTMKVYVNGELRGQKAYSGGIFVGTADVSIGAIASGGPPGQSAGNFTGRVDEPAIYNRALSASEIQAIFNAGSKGKCNP